MEEFANIWHKLIYVVKVFPDGRSWQHILNGGVFLSALTAFATLFVIPSTFWFWVSIVSFIVLSAIYLMMEKSFYDYKYR